MYQPVNTQAANLVNYLLHLGDNALILSQRNSEWCGHGPVLEQDIAITNISLDLIGQSRSFYQYAASLEGGDATEDSLAYLRGERTYMNCLMNELPNGDWGQTILRQFFFSVYQQLLYNALLQQQHPDLHADDIHGRAPAVSGRDRYLHAIIATQLHITYDAQIDYRQHRHFRISYLLQQ